LSVPVLMNWYHPLLILTWNAAVTPYFLPGQPFVWMLVAFIGVGFAVVNRLTSPEARFVSVPSVSRALLFLLLVVLVTAYSRGGVGLRVFGSTQQGGKGYFYIIGAIAGYFALISKRVPKEKAATFVALFFLVGVSSLVPNLAYFAGRRFEFLFYLFPPMYAYEQASGDYSVGLSFSRMYGLTFASNGLYCYLLARYGLRGIFDLGRPLRLVLFLAAALGCLFCGFRSFMLLFVLTLMAQFFAEKLYQPRMLVGVVAGLVVLAGVALPLLDHMPVVVQRSISFIPDRFLPVALNAVARASANDSSEWRLNMWADVLPEVPQYLLYGKGYKHDPKELEFALMQDRSARLRAYAWALVTSSYHNGPLTLLVPFGIWGVLGFLAFAVASIKYLLHNYRHGDPSLKTANTFLLAYFVAKLIYYLGVFGSFYSDFFVFTGIIGLSISVNGAIPQPGQEPVETPLEEPATVAER